MMNDLAVNIRRIPIVTLGIFLFGTKLLPLNVEAQVRTITNPSFEQNNPRGAATNQYEIFENSEVPGWSSTTNEIELWDTGHVGVNSIDGLVHAEMNAFTPGSLYQEVCLINGETINFDYYHRARSGGADPQIAIFEVADGTSTSIQQLSVSSLSVSDGWVQTIDSDVYTGPSGVQRIQFSTPNPGSLGNFLDNINISLAAFSEFDTATTSDLEDNSNIALKIVVNGNVNTTTSIPVNVSGGTATPGIDFTLTPTQVTIPPGSYSNQSFDIPITIIEDGIAEEDETIEITLGTPSTTGIILNDAICDGSLGQISSTHTIINEDGEITSNKTSQIYDPLSEGLYHLPGNDVIYTISLQNTGPLDIDDGSIFLIDTLPEEVIFYNGDIDDAGPNTNAISFSETGSGLTLSYPSDVGFSDNLSKPTNMSECNYSPNMGYDDNVRHICFSPNGVFLSGDPNPQFSVSFRAKIR